MLAVAIVFITSNINNNNYYYYMRNVCLLRTASYSIIPCLTNNIQDTHTRSYYPHKHSTIPMQMISSSLCLPYTLMYVCTNVLNILSMLAWGSNAAAGRLKQRSAVAAIALYTLCNAHELPRVELNKVEIDLIRSLPHEAVFRSQVRQPV